MSLALSAAPATAGQWVVTYSGRTAAPGATYNFTNSKVTGPPPFDMIPPNGFTVGPTLSLSASAPGTATLAVTTTLTWAPSYQGDTSLPPSSVGVIEAGSASASIYWVNPVGVKQPADDGFGDSPISQTPPLYGASSSGSHFTSVAVPAGAKSVTLPNTRTVTATLTCTSNQGGNGSGGFTLTYSATPVTVILTGPIQDSSGNQNILVGQGCKASLTGIPNGYTVSSYSWSVSDAAFTFQAWSGATQYMPPAPANANASYYSPGPGPLNNSTAHWYWDDKATTATVTCTATVTPPAGQGSAFSVTATQKVNIAVPQTTEVPKIGSVRINNHAPVGYGTNYALYLDGTSASQPYGIIFTTQVLTPALFASSSSGLWNMVQGVAPNFWTTLFPSLSETPDPKNGNSGLDTHYPLYPWSSSASPFFPSGIAANNLMAQPYDGPGIANLSNTISRYRVSQSFQTYVMYLPPGSDTQWVPLWLIAWHWNADAYAPIVNGLPSWPSWNNANSAGNAAIDSNAAALAFPTWTQIISG